MINPTILLRLPDKLTSRISLRKTPQKPRLLLMIPLPEHRDNSIGRLLGAVKRNAREQMMHHMVVNNMMKEMASNEPEIPIHSGQRPARKRPRRIRVVRDVAVRVVQIRNRDQPVMNPHIRHEVEQGHLEQSDLLSEVPNGGTDEEKTKVGDRNQVPLVLGPEGTRWVEVASAPLVSEPAVPFALDGAALCARCYVEAEVHLPPGELVHEKTEEGVDGGIFEVLQPGGEVAGAALVVLVCPGDEGRVALGVVCVAVVARVGDFPAEVGDQQEGVQGPADDVVDERVRREGAVAAFVREDPDAGADAALGEAVGGPGEDAQGLRGDQVDLERGVEEHAGVEEVPGDIGAGDGERAVEAVLGDCIADCFEGEFLGFGGLRG